MKIKNKTELRKEINRAIGNTGSLDKVHFWKDGDWEIYSAGTGTYAPIQKTLAVLSCGNIAENFRDIEEELEVL